MALADMEGYAENVLKCPSCGCDQIHIKSIAAAPCREDLPGKWAVIDMTGFPEQGNSPREARSDKPSVTYEHRRHTSHRKREEVQIIFSCEWNCGLEVSHYLSVFQHKGDTSIVWRGRAIENEEEGQLLDDRIRRLQEDIAENKAKRHRETWEDTNNA